MFPGVPLFKGIIFLYLFEKQDEGTKIA